MLVGRAGQVSLGQSAFVGLGAYAAAYAFGHGWGPVAALALAVALAGVVAVLVAIPAVRLRGFAFGIITLALPAFAVPLANRLVDLTGGSQGVAVVATTAPEWTGQADDQWRLYLVGVVAAIVFWVVHNLLDGRLGRALSAIRVNEAMAAANGVAVHRNKVLAFTVAGLCGGVAGWLYLSPCSSSRRRCCSSTCPCRCWSRSSSAAPAACSAPCSGPRSSCSSPTSPTTSAPVGPT